MHYNKSRVQIQVQRGELVGAAVKEAIRKLAQCNILSYTGTELGTTQLQSYLTAHENKRQQKMKAENATQFTA